MTGVIRLCSLQFRAVIDGSSPPIVVTKDIYIGTVPLCILRSCTTVGPLASGHYVTTSYDELAAFDDNDDDASYNSRPSAGSRLSLVDLVAATGVQAQVAATAVAGPSAPAMAAVLHAPPPEGPPPYEARPPPFAPGHDQGAADHQTSSTCCSDPQILQPPRE